VKAERHQIVAQRHEHTQEDRRRRRFAVCEQHAEDADPERAKADLPFALDAVRNQRAEQRPDRVGDRDDEGVFEVGGDIASVRLK